MGAMAEATANATVRLHTAPVREKVPRVNAFARRALLIRLIK
jgi:hypothetical protein